MTRPYSFSPFALNYKPAAHSSDTAFIDFMALQMAAFDYLAGPERECLSTWLLDGSELSLDIHGYAATDIVGRVCDFAHTLGFVELSFLSSDGTKKTVIINPFAVLAARGGRSPEVSEPPVYGLHLCFAGRQQHFVALDHANVQKAIEEITRAQLKLTESNFKHRLRA